KEVCFVRNNDDFGSGRPRRSHGGGDRRRRPQGPGGREARRRSDFSGGWGGYGGGSGRRSAYGSRRAEFGGGGGRHGGGGPRRARRGNVRAAILALLSEQPMHGYQMIQELSRRSGGAWTPSPGSIYPTLQMLEDEGLVISRQSPDGKRMFELTDAGRAEAGKARSDTGHRPWEESGHGRGGIPLDLVSAIRDTAIPLVYAATSGSDEQRAQVIELLTELREKLNAVVPGAPSPGDAPGPWGAGSRSRGRSGPGWSFGLPGWLFGGPPGGPFGPGGFWGSNTEEGSTRGAPPWAAAPDDDGDTIDGDAEDLDEEGDLEV
ncbi:MAG: PadR family transcriptional regulator, partial [Acidimicrobiales bacterium]